MGLVRVLVGRPPQSVEDLIDALGVTRTAVTLQLDGLIAAGYVEFSQEAAPGRGRPRNLYSATPPALTELFRGNHWLVVPALWRAIEAVGGNELKQQVIERVSLALAEHYKGLIKGKTPEERLRELARVLRKTEGNVVQIERGKEGLLAIHRRTCSFYSMFEQSRAVCRVDEKLLSLVLGARVRQTACRHDGDHCCVFTIVADK
jgi:predicted ArsR family transcriptional regulator